MNRVVERAVQIASHGLLLEGDLRIPGRARGLVIFAHGSGSSRQSPRNRAVAATLNDTGMATLLLDLLTAQEEYAERWTRHLRFDLTLLSSRLVSARKWASVDQDVGGLPVGYFGSSTGAAAALIATAQEPTEIGALVSRGGRPDLAGDALPQVRAPTQLILGAADEEVIALNQEAFARLRCEKQLRIVLGASHLFEEPGALEEVARMANDWFAEYLPRDNERWAHP
jgi:putative phosphoribosyl transferase